MPKREESVYQFICRMSEEVPGLPYSFQDPAAGIRDVNCILWEDSLPFPSRERMARDVLDRVAQRLEDDGTEGGLCDYLREHPLRLYMPQVSTRLKLMLSEGLLDADSLYSFGLRLAMESAFDEEVKLGMLILGFFENDLSRKVVRTLGYHSTLTIYAVEAANHFARPNDFIFTLAQNTSGYGRLTALHRLCPVHPAQRQWVFEQGADNVAVPNMCAIICLEKADMADFYRQLLLGGKNFHRLSHMIAFAAQHSDIHGFSQGMALAGRYLKAAERHASRFIDLAALVVIQKSLKPDRHPDGGGGPDAQREGCLHDACAALLSRPAWRRVAAEALKNPCCPAGMILLVLERIKIFPDFSAFLPLWERSAYDMDLMKFLLLEHSQRYIQDTAAHLLDNLPEEVYGGPQSLEIENLPPEYKADVWLLFLLKAFREHHCGDEALYIRCLNCRLPDARAEAARALRACRKSWSPAVLPALEKARALEPDNDNIRRLDRMLSSRTGKAEKESRTVDVSAVRASPMQGDIFLLSTYIAGTAYRDLEAQEGEVAAGDILCLLREPDNPYDRRAILVTDGDGYVLGYVPRAVNELPAALMDGGERLYAILTADRLSSVNPGIRIMLGRAEGGGVILPFPPPGRG